MSTPTIPSLYLTATLALSYLTYIDPLNFREFELIRQIESLPVLLIAVLLMLNLPKHRFS